MTSFRIHSPQALEVSDEEFRSLTGMPEGGTVQRSSGDKERFVVQVDGNRAYAWVSESVWSWNEDDESQRLALTSRTELMRSSAHEPWRVVQIERRPGIFLAHLATSADRRTHAVLANEAGEWLVRLDPDTGDWIAHQPLPKLLPSWLADSRMRVRYFWSNGAHQVVSLWGDVVVPRLLFPFSEEPASITTDAHFHTSDSGRTWHQLAIPGYLGVMGLAHHEAEMFWTKGNWYTNDEPYVWRYGLAE